MADRDRFLVEGVFLFLAPVLVMLVASCDIAPEGSGSSSQPAAWTVDPAPLVTIGEVEGDPPYLFSRITAVQLLPDRRIVVADRTSATIRVYRPPGEFTHLMGGIGQGPGELTSVDDVSFVAPDTLAVYDWRLQRLTKFLASGELASTLRFQGGDGRPEIHLGTTSEEGHVLVWIRQEPRDASVITPDVMRVGRFGPDGRLAEVLTTTVGMRRRGNVLPFSPHFLSVMIGDSVFLTDGLDGTIEVIDAVSGASVRTIRIETEERDPDMAYRALEATLDSGRVEQLREVRGASGTDSIPAFADLLTDDEGRLWLKEYDPATDSHWLGRRRTGGEWLVVRTDGRVVARVAFPDDLRLMEVRGERMAGVTRGELGVERVQVHQLERD